MCGITGYAGLNAPALLRKMCSVIVHRGPDEDGFYVGDAIGLAMRRLAVIDLKTGSQPIANEAGNVRVVFNGEIYNFEELRKTLEASGHAFSTNSDTETIVHLYEEYGLDFVDYLQGMFAIALWDECRERLLLVRDRIGEKPLYYAFDEGKLFFGSEIKTILQAGLRGRWTRNPSAIFSPRVTSRASGRFLREFRRSLLATSASTKKGILRFVLTGISKSGMKAKCRIGTPPGRCPACSRTRSAFA